MKISAWAIRNPIPVSVLFILLLIAGGVGYGMLPVKLLPDVSFPTVQVGITLPGAAPTEIETQITRQVEAATSNISGVDHVESTVSLGSSTSTIKFAIGEDAQRATDEVRSAIDRIRGDLPRDIEEPIVERVELDGAPVVTYAVVAPRMSDVDLSWFVDDTVTRQLATVKGVAQVRRLGGVDREINVTLDPDRLEALGLTAIAVNKALRTFNVDAPGGRVDIGGRTQTVRVLGAADTVSRLGETTIPVAAGRQVRLSDIATVTSGAGARSRFAQLDHEPVVAFQIMKTKEASDVAVDDATADTIARLAQKHPGVAFRKIVSTAQSTRDSFSATLHTLIEGMILAALVVFCFLREWRSTVIAAIAMPISLVPTFAAMAALGFSLNIITLLALTLVIGILVDDAIVEIENIEKRIEAGEKPFDAALIGADAIGLAVIATTMSIVVVFLPVALMPGFAGQFFREFGLTVAVAVLFSLLVARLLTPLLAAYFLRPARHPREHKPFNGAYRRAVEWALVHRWLSIGGAGALFAGSIALASLLPTGFTPASDNGIVQMTLEGAPGATVDDMRRAVVDMTDRLKKTRSVARVFSSVGAGGDVGSGEVTILLDPERSETTQAFQARIRPLLSTIPDVRIGSGQGGGGGSPSVQIILASDDGGKLGAAAAQLERQMRRLPMLANVHRLTPPPGSELVIRPKPDEASRLGVTAETLAGIVRVAMLGDVDANTAKFNQGQQRLPIRVRLSDAARSDIETIANLRVPLDTGGAVPLSAVADVDFEPGVTRIERFDRELRATVEAELNGVALGDALAEINKLPIIKRLPDGVTQPAYGAAEDMGELFGSFGGAMLAGIALIFGVLFLLFRSFFKPVTILAALPLSLAGAFVALLAGAPSSTCRR